MPLTTILTTDLVSASRATINDNFTYLDGKSTFTRSLVAATGNEVAWVLNYTTNKAAGNDTGLQINMTDTASPGTSKTFEITVDTVEKFSINAAGSISGSGGDHVMSNIRSSGNTINWGSGNISFGLNGLLNWAGVTDGSAAKEIGISRTSAGLLQINNGTAGKWAGLDTGLINMKSLATPTGLTVAPQGTTGATTYGYKVAALLADGTITTAATTEVTIANGNATLTATEFNRVSWTAVTGATSYNVFRITGGATQGKITATPITAVTLDDTGIAASGAAPTVNGTGSLLWATDGGGDIGKVGANRPSNIYASGVGTFGGQVTSALDIQIGQTSAYKINNVGRISAPANGVILMTDVGATVFTRLEFGMANNSWPALATGTINGFAIQSAAGTLTYNDAVTAGSGTVAQRHLVFIDTPTLTATNASVTYTQTCTLHLGLPTASTNITFSNPAKSLLCDGPVDASKYYIGGVVGYNGSITLAGTTSITVAYGIITGIV